MPDCTSKKQSQGQNLRIILSHELPFLTKCSMKSSYVDETSDHFWCISDQTCKCSKIWELYHHMNSHFLQNIRCRWEQCKMWMKSWYLFEYMMSLQYLFLPLSEIWSRAGYNFWSLWMHPWSNVLRVPKFENNIITWTPISYKIWDVIVRCRWYKMWWETRFLSRYVTFIQYLLLPVSAIWRKAGVGYNIWSLLMHHWSDM